MSRLRAVHLGLVATLGIVASANSAVAASGPGPSQAQEPALPGQVFTMSNDPAGNEVIAFDVGRSGSLSPAGTYETGGTGLGAGLGSQGSLVTSEDGRYLLAVNAGSDEVSVFRIAQHGLFLVDTDPSGGQTPTSVAIHRNLVYVLNNGDDTISGYRLGWRGLTPIGGSTRSLSQPADAGQVSFTPDGNQLVVTQKDTNTVDVFNVDRSGRTSAPVANPSTGATPFGFAFDKYEHLVVSNAGGGVVNGSSVTSYRISSSGELHVLDGPAPTDQSAACWVIISPDGQYAYTTNAGSNTVSGFKVDRDGDLVRLDADGVTATTGQGPIDGAFSDRTGYLFVLTGGADAIDGFRMTRDGGLAPVSQLGGLPAQSVGLAAT